MGFKLEITDAAKLDLQLSYEWYEQRLTGLGNEFIEAIEEQLNVIVQHPDSNPFFIEDYRKVNTRRFPFKIIYSILKNKITIHAVYHHSRNIEKWRK